MYHLYYLKFCDTPYMTCSHITKLIFLLQFVLQKGEKRNKHGPIYLIIKYVNLFKDTMCHTFEKIS